MQTIQYLKSTLSDSYRLSKFLQFLDKDISINPDRILPLNSSLVKRINSLVCGIEIDIDAPLLDDEE